MGRGVNGWTRSRVMRRMLVTCTALGKPRLVIGGDHTRSLGCFRRANPRPSAASGVEGVLTELGKKVPGRVSAAGAERVRPHDLAYLGLVSGFWVGGIWRARRDHILHRCAAPWVGSWPPVVGEGEKLPDHRRDRGVSNGVRTYCRGEKSGRDTNRDGSEER